MNWFKLQTFLCATLINFYIAMITVSAVQSYDPKENNSSDHSIILSRKRRYLIFPEGSSFQLVYDQTLPIVGIELVFTVGITCALAWELPSKPLYQIAQEIRERLKSEEMSMKNDENVANISYVDTNVAKNEYNSDYYQSSIDRNSETRPATTSKYDNYYYYSDGDHQSTNNFGNYFKDNNDQGGYYKNPSYYIRQAAAAPVASKNKFNYYYNNGYNNYPIGNKSASYYGDKLVNQFQKWPTKLTGNNWLSTINRVTQQYMNNRRIGQAPMTQQQQPAKQQKLRKKKIFPFIGKRSIDNEINRKVAEKEHKLFQTHHRSTRHALYYKIEVYLESRGLDGRACLLKTLCESGEKKGQNLPNSFTASIMKTIFTLPEPVDAATEEIHESYDQAHHSQEERNCTELYPECEGSLWTADFIF